MVFNKKYNLILGEFMGCARCFKVHPNVKKKMKNAKQVNNKISHIHLIN